jgi:hypothetical protein
MSLYAYEVVGWMAMIQIILNKFGCVPDSMREEFPQITGHEQRYLQLKKLRPNMNFEHEHPRMRARR